MPTALDLKDRGLAHFRAERLEEAAEAFAQAAHAFAEQNERASAAEMMNNVAVVCLAQQKYALALNAVQGTPAVFRALGDPLREAQATMNLGNALDNLGRLTEALPKYEHAIALFTELGETENRAVCWKALSTVQIKLDKKLQALASMHAGLTLTPELSTKEKTLKGLLDQAMKLLS